MKLKPAFTGILHSFVIVVLCAATSTAYSFGFQPKQPSLHSGWVMARSVERDEDGKVKWVTYDAYGRQSNLELEGDCDETCVVMGAAEFNAWQQGFQNFMALALNKNLIQGAGLMTAEAYVQGKGEFKTVDGQQRMNAPELNRSTRSVYVRSKKQWYTPDSRIVLFESPLDTVEMERILRDEIRDLGETGSVLLNREGKVVGSSGDESIGLAVKWFDGERYGAEETVPAGSRPTNAPIMNQTQIYGGIPGIVIEGPTAFDEPKTMSESGSGDDEAANRRGFYFLRYLVPCIPNDFVDYQSTLAARLPYSRFTPTTAYPSYTYATRMVTDYCNSVGLTLGLGGAPTLGSLMANVEAMAVHATTATPITRTPIYVDVLYMTGKIKMQNADGSAVQFGGETQYGAINPTAAEDAVIGPFDFDGDGKADRSERGTVDAQQNFTPDAEGDKVAIYLSSDPAGVPIKNSAGETIGYRPHFVRLIDQKMEPKAGGYTVLNTVSLADLKDTDLYLYRTSNGHLVKHQARLTDNDFKNKDGQLPTSGDVQWGYVMNYLGPQAYRPPTRSWADLQNETVTRTDSQGESNTTYADDFLRAAREADHLRIGESLTLVAINRKTGYMGTTTARVEAPGSSGSGSLSFKVNDLILRPPNLKIMAVREYEVEAGATKGQMRSYNIGMEGAALKKDKYVEIDSLWLDENDQMLPEDLGTRGYTGRLAKVAGDKLNDTQVSQFSIQPGLHKNMIKLGAGGQGDLGNEHYYLHVSGGVKDDAEAFRKPDFSTLGGDESGIWSSRPKWAVPFKVTTSREVQDLQEQMAYHDARNNSEPNSEAPKSPQANYGWEYRPEFQFSVFDLQVKEITQCGRESNADPIPSQCNKNDADTGANKTIVVYSKADKIDTALFDPYLDLLQIIFTLTLPSNNRLEAFGGNSEVLLSLGGNEHQLSGSGEKKEIFTNLKGLEHLDSEEYLALRLFLNNDANNVLWEYVDPIPVLNVRRLRQATNLCNWVPNSKQINAASILGYGIDTLFIVQEPSAAKASVFLENIKLSNGIDTASNQIRIRARNKITGNYVEAEVEKHDLKVGWEIYFPLEDSSEDVEYELWSYVDRNNNKMWDAASGDKESEPTALVKYGVYGELGLRIFVAPVSSYESHKQKLLSNQSEYAGPLDGAGVELISIFRGGATQAFRGIYPNSYRLEYSHKNRDVDGNTPRDIFLTDRGWIHGAGVVFSQPAFNADSCSADVPLYNHNKNSYLTERVTNSDEFKETLVNKNVMGILNGDMDSAVACAANQDCVQSKLTHHIDVDMEFSSVFNAELAAAIGSAKMQYDMKARKKEGIISESYDIHINGEVYDFYDFDMGKKTGGLKDFNSDGAWIEIGFGNNRKVGGVFITSVNFDIYYHVECNKISGCEYSPDMQFSSQGDF